MYSGVGDATAASSSCGAASHPLIERYRKERAAKKAAEKAAEERADGDGCGGGKTCLVNKVNKQTGKKQNELKLKLTREELEEFESMLINEDVEEMDAQFEDIIRQRDGEKGVEALKAFRQKNCPLLREMEEFSRQFHLYLDVKELRKEKDQLYSKLLSERERCNVLVQVQREQILERDEEIASLRKRIKDLEFGR